MIPKRVVLDTNVCLDLFVFRDPRWDTLLASLRDGSVKAITRSDCRREWQIVLSYTHLQLDENARQRANSEFDTLIACLDDGETPLPVQLPICKDKDDQKFMETAYAANAEALITKDKALLKLARRTAKAGLFKIMLPQVWTAHAADPPDAQT